MKTIKRLEIATTGAIVVAGGLLAGTAFAQAPETAYPAWVTRLAQQLGKTEADVYQEARAAHEQLLDQAVRDGRITEDQAQALRERFEQAGLANGPMYDGRGPQGPQLQGPHHLGPFGPQAAPGAPPAQGPRGPRLNGPLHQGPQGPMVGTGAGYQYDGRAGFGSVDRGPAMIAAFLGIQPQDLYQAHLDGKSLATIAAEQGKTRDELKAFLLARQAANLDAAVQAGRLTADEAAQLVAQQAQRVDEQIDQAGPVVGRRGQQAGARDGSQPWWAQ